MFYEGYEIVSMQEFQPAKSKAIKSKGKRPDVLIDYVCLDTETSHNHNINNPIGWIYQWAFTYKKTIVQGRKPSEIVDAVDKILKINNCSAVRSLYIFVHNLPYDWQYIGQFFIERYGVPEILADAPHKVFRCTFNCGITFCCSYKLTNKSLDKFTSDLGTKHRKLCGEIDYNIIRYQDTELNESDYLYMWHDVIALDEGIEKQLDLYGDSLASMPITSTGYVRRELRVAYKEDFATNRRGFLRSALNEKTYTMMRAAYSGGYTHGNRHYKGLLLEKEHYTYDFVGHRDFSSHFPTQQIIRDMPMSQFFNLYNYNKKVKFTFEDLHEYFEKYFCVCTVILKDLQLKPEVTAPTLQFSKIEKWVSGTHFIQDNGRILKIEGTAVITLTDLDLFIVEKQYVGKIVFKTVIASKKGKLPEFMTKTIMEHFLLKSELKEKVKRLKKEGAPEDQILNANIQLMKSKNLLNGIYGCSATDPIRDDLVLNEKFEYELKITVETLQDKLNNFYNSKNNFMRYAWGVYTTAWARFELFSFIELIGYDRFLYCDTDSIFYLSTPEIEKRIEKENTRMKKESIKNNWFVDAGGEKVTLNTFDLEETKEADKIKEFKFLHAKCYCCKHNNNTLSLTVAGVKHFGQVGQIGMIIDREHELKDINNLDEGYTFKYCGGTRSIYINLQPQILTINGHTTELASSVVIENVTKTLSYDDAVWYADQQAIKRSDELDIY